ncbi:MAG: sigma-70 family RNA polymerase sigma factor, partial [Bdellovibrionales bacterium]|nr:sigma-70 family RNA polymerase sigma factor [Bdellovibrionales bacterium]
MTKLKAAPEKAKPKAKAKAPAKAKKPSSEARSVEAEIIDPAAGGIEDTDTDSGIDFPTRVAEEADEWQSRGWQDHASQSLSPDREPEFAEIKKLITKEPLNESLGEAVIESSEKSLTTSAASSDPVAVYMAEVRRYPLLTREQEQELARRYRETGDKRAAEALVTSNLRFVVKVAAEYSRFGARLIDLVQEGNVGLMHAVREFNPYKGVRLITYAVWWIRGYIQDYLMRQYSMVRIGTTQSQRKLFYRLQKEKDLLESMGEEPTVKLLSSRLGVSESDVESMSQRMQGRDVSLQTAVDD